MKIDKTSGVYKSCMLGILCAVCGILLSTVNAITAPIIEENALASVKSSLEQIYPGATFTDVTEDKIGLLELKDGEEKLIDGIYNAEGKGTIFTLHSTGYNADGFTFMIAYNNDGSVAGYSVLEQAETAGKGDKAFKDPYVSDVLKLTSSDTMPLISGATITTGNDYYVTSWVVNLTPSDITQVGLLNATVKDQIVNPYTVDTSKLTGTGVNPADELAGPYLKHSFVLHLVNGAVQTLSADQILPAITFTPNGYTLDFARLNNQVNFAGFQPLIQDCWLEYKTIVPANVTQVDNRATLDFDGNTDNFTREGWWINPRGAGTATGEQQVSVSVSKVWEDQNNADGTRPTSVTVHLYADGVDTGKSEVLSDANGWTATFSNLDKNQAGTTTAITYTVVEDEVVGYNAEVTGDVTSGFTITNTHIPPTPTTPPSETPKKPKQPKKKESKLPSTGDASFAAASVAAASSVLIAAGVLGKKRVQ